METYMNKKHFRLALLASLFGVASLLPLTTMAQESADQTAAAQPAERQFLVQVYVVVASNDGGTSEIPAPIEATIRQLRQSLLLRNYKLAATFVARGTDRTGLQARALLGRESLESTGEVQSVPYEIVFSPIKATSPVGGQDELGLSKFKFEASVPVIVAMARGGGPNSSQPVFENRSVALDTSLRLRDGQPAVAGTLTTGQPDKQIVLIVLIKRAD
jgi:hypothetical protein